MLISKSFQTYRSCGEEEEEGGDEEEGGGEGEEGGASIHVRTKCLLIVLYASDILRHNIENCKNWFVVFEKYSAHMTLIKSTHYIDTNFDNRSHTLF